MALYQDFWEVERIGIVIACSCVVMVIFNRIHKYIPLFKCWSKETDSCEVEHRTFRYIPDSLEKLQSQTKFKKEELKVMYRNFKNECPHGVINEETFKNIYAQFFPTGDGDLYAHFVFQAFDNKNEGIVTFEKFVIVLSSLLRGDINDRLSWTFSLYDANRDGYITKEDVREVVRSIFMLLGNYTEPHISEEICEDHTERVFSRLDVKGENVVTFDEFCQVCRNDELMYESLSLFQDCV